MDPRHQSERVSMNTTPIAYAFKRRHGAHRVLCLACCGEVSSLALEVHDTDDDRGQFGVPSDDERVVVCHECGERMDVGVLLRVLPEEIPVLRFALDAALSAISEAHAEDRAQLKALIERLEAAQKGARS